MDGDAACSQHEATAFCTEEMDRVLFQRGVPIRAGITVTGHGRGAAAMGHAAATVDPGRGVAAAGLGRGASATGHAAATMGVGLGAAATGHAATTIGVGLGAAATSHAAATMGVGLGTAATGHAAATVGIGRGASAIGRTDVQMNGDEGLPQGGSSTAPAAFNCNGNVHYYREGDEGYVPPFDMADDQFYGLDMNGDSSHFCGRGHSRSRGRSSGHTHARQAPSVVARIRATGSGAARCFAPASLGIPEESFFLGGSAIRCKVPSSSAMHEMVPKQNIVPGRRVILHLKVMAIELTLINDKPPT
jgi:hypothetical protein